MRWLVESNGCVQCKEIGFESSDSTSIVARVRGKIWGESVANQELLEELAFFKAIGASTAQGPLTRLRHIASRAIKLIDRSTRSVRSIRIGHSRRCLSLARPVQQSDNKGLTSPQLPSPTRLGPAGRAKIHVFRFVHPNADNKDLLPTAPDSSLTPTPSFSPVWGQEPSLSKGLSRQPYFYWRSPRRATTLSPQIGNNSRKSTRGVIRGHRPILPQLGALLALALALALGSSADARQPGGGGDVTLQVISAWGGPVNTVHIEGNLAYIGSGRRMVILNITDFENITEVGSIQLLSTVEDLAVRDGFAYVATQHEIFGYGFCSVNVSDPSNPTLASNPDAFGNFQPRLVELYQNFAFAQSTDEGPDSPHVFDITDPENVIWVGKDFLPSVDTIAIVGDFLYVADGEELRIYDLSKDPVHPALIGTANAGFQASDAYALAVEGSYACVNLFTQDDEILVVFNVSNPRAPSVTGTYVLPNHVSVHPNGLALSGGLAYVATGRDDSNDDGLFIFDVASDPSNPTLIITYETHAPIYGVKVVGTTAYLFDAGEGLIILDVSDPVNPAVLGKYHSPAYLRKMKKVDSLLYISDAWNGFSILDVSDPHSTPNFLGSYQIPGNHESGIISVGNWGLDVRDGFAYLSEGRNGFEVVDVSNPANPVSVGAVKPWPDGVTAMDLKLNSVTEPPFTDILHIGTKPGAWLVNFDVTNLSNITEIGSAFLGGGQPYVYDIEVTPDDQYAHVARDLAVQVIDVSDPKTPEVVYTGGPNRVLDIALDGNIRHLANNDLSGCDNLGALHVQDVFDPANPTDLVIVDWCYGDLGIHELTAVTIANDRAYVVANFSPPETPAASDFVVVFDVTEPSVPVLLDFVKVGEDRKTALLVDDPYLFVTTHPVVGSGDGLVIIEVVVARTCPWDIDGSGNVGVKDFLLLLGAWGPNKGHPADFDGDGDVGVSDFLALLGAWGPCP